MAEEKSSETTSDVARGIEMLKPAVEQGKDIVPPLARITSGISGLDELLHGGFPEISTVMVSGASGTGKTMFCTQSLFYSASNERKSVVCDFLRAHLQSDKFCFQPHRL